MTDGTHIAPSYALPTLLDNRLYTIRGDLIELRRHVRQLIADGVYCGLRAGSEIAGRCSKVLHEVFEDFSSVNPASPGTISLKPGRHPRAVVVVGLAAGIAAGVLLSKVLHSKT